MQRSLFIPVWIRTGRGMIMRKRFLLIALICALLIILHLTDTSIRSEEDIARYLGLDTLVVLPYDADLAKNEEPLNKKKKK